MWDDIKKALPGFLLGLVATIVINLVVVSAQFATVKTQVNNLQDQVKDFVPREEHNQVYKWQEKYMGDMNGKIDKLDNKVDKLNDKLDRVLEIRGK
jgi:uncharacterized protein YoxC